MDEYGSEFVLTARRATTGDTLMQHSVAAMDLDCTWKLKLRLADHMRVSSPFGLRLVQGRIELDDTQQLRTYVRSGLLEVEVVTQKRRICTLQRKRCGRCWQEALKLPNYCVRTTTNIAACDGHQLSLHGGSGGDLAAWEL